MWTIRADTSAASPIYWLITRLALRPGGVDDAGLPSLSTWSQGLSLLASPSPRQVVLQQCGSAWGGFLRASPLVFKRARWRWLGLLMALAWTWHSSLPWQSAGGSPGPPEGLDKGVDPRTPFPRAIVQRLLSAPGTDYEIRLTFQEPHFLPE